MTTLCLITSHLPMDDEPLPSPVVVATIETDPRLLRHALDPAHLLAGIASKMGLLRYAIVDGESQSLPGTQLELFKH